MLGRLAEYGNATFEYGYDGLRTSKYVGGVYTTYYYLNGKLLGEKRGSTNIQYVYDSSGIAGMVYGGNDYVFRKDIQGNVVAIYRGNTLMAQYEYDAWGRCKIVSESSGIGTLNPFRYRGYYYDSETGLYYLRTRYYDPETGRFLSPDSVDNLAPEEIGGLNLFAYCLNNPVMNVDPNGTGIITVLSILASLAVGALIGGAGGMITAAVNGGDIGAGFVGGAISGLITTVGSALGMATGGFLGFAIVGFAGLAGGALGSITEQGISKGWDKIDYNDALISGAITAGTSIFTFGLAYTVATHSAGGFDDIFDKTIRFSSRFIEALKISAGSLVLTGMTTLPMTIINILIECGRRIKISPTAMKNITA